MVKNDKKLNIVRFNLPVSEVQKVKKYAQKQGIVRPRAYEEIFSIGLAQIEAQSKVKDSE